MATYTEIEGILTRVGKGQTKMLLCRSAAGLAKLGGDANTFVYLESYLEGMGKGGGFLQWKPTTPHGGTRDWITTYPTSDGGTTSWVRDWNGDTVYAAWNGCIADEQSRKLNTICSTVAEAQERFGVGIIPANANLATIELDWAAAMNTTRQGIYKYRVRVVLPAGVLVMSDTFTVGALTPADGYVGGVVEAAGFGIQDLASTRFKPLFRNRPVVNVQASRGIYLNGLGFLVPGSIGWTGAPSHHRADVSLYSDPAWTTGRHNSFCLFAIDAYSGPPPGATPADRYPGVYGCLPSHGVNFDGCDTGNIAQAQVGLLIQPGNYAQNGEQIVYANGGLSGVYGFSSGDHQSNIVTIRNCNIGPCHTAFDGLTHGDQRGDMPSVIDCIGAGHIHRVFNFDMQWSNPKAMINNMFESCASVGRFISHKAGGMNFIATTISCDHTPQNSPAIQLVTGCPTDVNGGSFYVTHPDPRGCRLWNIITDSSRVKFTNVALGDLYTDRAMLLSPNVEYERVDKKAPLPGEFRATDRHFVANRSGRFPLSRTVQTVTLGNKTHDLVHPPPLTLGGNSEIVGDGTMRLKFNPASVVFSLGGGAPMGRRMTLTLDEPLLAAYVRPDDFAYWRIAGGSHYVPCMAVVSANATTGVIVYDVLYTDLDEASRADIHGVARIKHWVEEDVHIGEPVLTAVAGDGVTLTFDRPTGCLPGAWLWGLRGPTAPLRVVSAVGSTVVASHNISVESVGKPAYGVRIMQTTDTAVYATSGVQTGNLRHVVLTEAAYQAIPVNQRDPGTLYIRTA